jgi:Low specificity phosphatase (HAD superfamily)
MFLKQNIEYLIGEKNVDLLSFLTKNEVEKVEDFSVDQLVEIGNHYDVNLKEILFTDLKALATNLNNVKLLILDVDGVMTDGGMYFTENGDQFKKYNTKDGWQLFSLQRKIFR